MHVSPSLSERACTTSTDVARHKDADLRREAARGFFFFQEERGSLREINTQAREPATARKGMRNVQSL